MRTAIICGTFKAAESLKHWLPLLPNVTIYRLPNPVREPEVEHTVEGYARWFAPHLADKDLIIGQSLGGTVAMCCDAPGRVIAIDPPLSTDGFRPIVPYLARIVRAGMDYPEIWQFMRNVYGWRDGEPLEPRDYHPLVRKGSVIAPIDGGLISPEDEERLGGVMRIQGGHDLMTDNPRAILFLLKVTNPA